MAVDADKRTLAEQSDPLTFVKDGRLVKHGRYYRLMLAEGHLTRRLLGSMVWRIGALAVATG